MKTNRIHLVLACGLAMAASVAAQATNSPPGKWSLDVSLYGLAASMSGDIAVKGIPADLDVGFDQIWDNLDSGLMGKVRIGHGRWALITDLIYMGLETEKNGVEAEFDQWLVSPAIGYRASPQIELLAGVSYNNLSGEIRGPGILPTPRVASGTQEWWDPFVGSDSNLPLTQTLTFHLRSDIGGFGVGSDLTWQLFPYASWRFAPWGSLQAGYRWLYADYEDGSGANLFRYDVLSQGPQLGITGHF